MSKKSLFKKAEYDYLEKMISFESESEARKSIKKLREEFNSAKTKTKKLRVARAVNFSANRAFASSKRKNLTNKERGELKSIGRLYRNLSESLFKKYRTS